MSPSDPNPFTGSTDNPNYFSAWAFRLGLLNDQEKHNFKNWVESCISKVPYTRWPGVEGAHEISQDELLGMIDAFPEHAAKILKDLEENNYFARLDRHPWFIPYVRHVAGHKLTIYEIFQWSIHILATAFFPGKDKQGRLLTSGALLCWMTSFRAPKYMYPLFWIFKKNHPLVDLFEIYFANIPEFIGAARRLK